MRAYEKTCVELAPFPSKAVPGQVIARASNNTLADAVFAKFR